MAERDEPAGSQRLRVRVVREPVARAISKRVSGYNTQEACRLARFHATWGEGRSPLQKGPVLASRRQGFLPPLSDTQVHTVGAHAGGGSGPAIRLG